MVDEKKLWVRVRPSDGSGGWYVVGRAEADSTWQAALAEIRPGVEPGTTVESDDHQSYEIGVVEMTQAEVDALGEFDGW